jgi:arylsulfatase A-like enzyme
MVRPHPVGTDANGMHRYTHNLRTTAATGAFATSTPGENAMRRRRLTPGGMWAAWVMTAVVLATRGSVPTAAAEPLRPNILLIVADDLGWGDVGWHGGYGKTPSMDRLVREGVELDRHYVQPVCTPTRAALMTGRYPGRFGPHAIAPSNLRALPPGTVTLASALRSLGYATFHAGKWHLGSRPEWGPNHYGFDHSYGTLTGAADPWTHKYRRGPYEDTWHRDGERLDEPGNATELIAAEAERRIRGGAPDASGVQTPWFLSVAFHAVHTPVDAPAEFKRLYDGIRFDAADARHDSRLRLAAMVSQLDAAVGRLVAALDETGQRSNTLIVFTSDNGGIESLDNQYVGDVPDSPLNSENDPLRGQKNSLWEGGVRVCAFANWPGRLAPRRCSAVVHAADWFPTLAGLVGWVGAPSPDWDGIDRWAAIAGGAGAESRPQPVCIVHQRGRAVIGDRWKLIVWKKEAPQLFDLVADPFETTDLAAEQAEVVASYRKVAEADERLDVADLPADLRDAPP